MRRQSLKTSTMPKATARKEQGQGLPQVSLARSLLFSPASSWKPPWVSLCCTPIQPHHILWLPHSTSPTPIVCSCKSLLCHCWPAKTCYTTESCICERGIMSPRSSYSKVVGLTAKSLRKFMTIPGQTNYGCSGRFAELDEILTQYSGHFPWGVSLYRETLMAPGRGLQMSGSKYNTD